MNSEPLNPMKKIIIIAFWLCAIQTTWSATYDIPHGGLTDHGLAATSGTLAWYFATYGSGHTYRLSDGANYYTSRPLNLPANSTLTVASSVTAVIKAGGNSSSPIYDSSLLVVGDNSTVIGRNANYNTLIIDANHLARVGINADSTTNVLIKDCTVRNTLNYYPTGSPGDKKQHLIDGDYSENLTVNHCLLRNAGYPAQNLPPPPTVTYKTVAKGVSLDWSVSGEVIYCDIANTLGASIAIAEAVTTEIGHNILQSSGLVSSMYGQPYSEDSIIGYHHTVTAGTNKAIYIRYNTIKHWGNHGIHVSGRGIHINYNTITNGFGHAIYLGDWRTPPECSGDSTITHNTVSSGTNDPTYSIKVAPYKSGTVTVSGNTGSGATYWGATCTY